MQRLMPGRARYPGYGGVLLLFSCWDWSGAELTGLRCLVQQLQSLLVFPLSHLGEEADKAGPRLSAMLVPLCICLGVQMSLALSPRAHLGVNQGWSFSSRSCWVQTCFCVYRLLLGKAR